MTPSPAASATPFDPDGGSFPTALDPLFSRPDSSLPVLLLVAGAQARANGWAQRSAVALAAAIVERGGRVVLADLGFDEPSLHEAVGEGNEEGLADIFLFGTSMKRVAHPVPQHGFFFVPAGPYTPDPAEVLGHPRWERLIDSLSEAQATLVAFAPADVPGLAQFARRAGVAALLVEPGEEDAAAAALPQETMVSAVLTPPAPPAPEPEEETFATLFEEGPPTREPRPEETAAAPASPPPAEPATEPEVADEWPAAEAAPPAAVDAELPPSPDEELAAAADDEFGAPADEDYAESIDDAAAAGVEPPTPRAHLIPGEPEEDRELALPPPEPLFPDKQTEGRRRGPLLWILVPVLLAALGYAAWQGYLYWQERTAIVPMEPAPAEAVPRPVAPAVPFSVVVETHQDLDAAVQRAAELGAQETDVGFQVVPVLVDSIVYYRILAGPLTDRERANALLARLVEAGHVPAADPFAIRMTRWALPIGEFEAEAPAEARAAELTQQGVPAYPLEIPYSSGPSRWRVYAGAYESDVAAQIMTELLAGIDVQAPLIERVGRPLDIELPAAPQDTTAAADTSG